MADKNQLERELVDEPSTLEPLTPRLTPSTTAGGCSPSRPASAAAAASSTDRIGANVGERTIRAKRQDTIRPALPAPSQSPPRAPSQPLSPQTPQTPLPLSPQTPQTPQAAQVPQGSQHQHQQQAQTAAAVRTSTNTSTGTSNRNAPANVNVLVISGGSGYNDLVGATPGATFVMPVSDNGGSSSEIIRVLGGPSIGDLRSRLVRLIPLSSSPSSQHPSTPTPTPTPSPPPSNDALHALLSYRLPSKGSAREVKQEWMDILEGRHRLWRGIEHERKECVRGFLVHFESEILRRAHRNFNFRGGSIGNFFLAAAQKFFRSIQSAIFLFSVTTQINASLPSPHISAGSKVLPVINTNHTATIAAELENGEVIVGQCEISHPARPRGLAPSSRASGPGLGLGTPSGPPSGTLSTQPPGTPSSAIFDPFSNLPSAMTSSDRLDLDLDLGGSTGAGAGAGTGARQTVGNWGDGLEPDDDDDDDDDNDGSIADDDVDDQSDGSEPEFDGAEDETQLEGDEPEANGAGAGEDGKRSRRRKRRRDARDARDDAGMGNIVFTKVDEEDEVPLGSRIKRIFYINAYRNEIYPAPNPEFVHSLNNRSEMLIYSCGSLWTSIIPCLALRGVGTAIARSKTLRAKVLLLNTTHDRETKGMAAVDYVRAIASSINQNDIPPCSTSRSRSRSGASTMRGPSRWELHQLVSHVVYFEKGQVPIDVDELENLGIRCVRADPAPRGDPEPTASSRPPRFDEDVVRRVLDEIMGWEER